MVKSSNFALISISGILCALVLVSCLSSGSDDPAENTPNNEEEILNSALDSADQYILDTDGDGIADLADDDIDGDGILNVDDADMDGDGILNVDDVDMDGDGLLNVADADMDGDGILNSADSDLDGDGIDNGTDPDIDGDGIANADDTDSDGDGIPDTQDNTVGGESTVFGKIRVTAGDLDGDGIDNLIDPDIDGDGIANADDDDLDGDGIPNDTDDIFGVEDPGSTDPGTDPGTNPDSGSGTIPDGPISDTSIGTTSDQDGSADRIKARGVDQCYWGIAGNDSVAIPLVMITHAVSDSVVDLVVVFSPHFVDNTWGVNAVGYNHQFKHVWGSDHVELTLRNGNDSTVMQVKLDLLSPTDKVASGYASLGPVGGDGEIIIGSVEDILSFGTTADDDLNALGYDLLEHSPKTDSAYTPNPDYPDWEYKVAYRMTLKRSLFGASGYGDVFMSSVHASPSKTAHETVEVYEGECQEGDDFTLIDKTGETYFTDWTE